MTDLEELSDKIEQAGKKWVVAKQISERLDELKSAILATSKNDLEAALANKSESASEQKLERLARGSAAYKEHIELMVKAKRVTHSYFLSYEALKNLYEAKRSDMAMERAKMNLL